MTMLKTKFRLNRPMRCWVTLSLACALGVSLSSWAVQVPNYKITYEVVIKKLVAGDLIIEVNETDAGDVTIRGETFPNMLARTFGDGKIIEIIKYQKVGEELRLKSVKEIKGEDQSQVKESFVDWNKKTIRIGDKTVAFTSNTQMDAYTLPFLRVLGVDEASKGSSTTVVSAKRIQDYVYENPVAKTIKVEGKSYETTRYTKFKKNDKTRKISLWLSKTSPAIPLKIEVTHKGKPYSWVTVLKTENN